MQRGAPQDLGLGRSALLRSESACAPGYDDRKPVEAQQEDLLGPFLLVLALQGLTTLVTDQLSDLLLRALHLDDGIFIDAAEDLVSVAHLQFAPA